jgi:hypothetical protein
MTFDELKSECDAMQAELECMTPNELNAVIERAKRLAAYHARSGYLLAEAKMCYHKKMVSETADLIKRILSEDLSKTLQNVILKAIAIEEDYLVTRIAEINSSCERQIDLMRTIISKEKEEMRMAGVHGM